MIELILYLLMGAGAGLIAGLFGVGGGVILVPALIVLFSAQGFDQTIVTQLAVGTSLACIVVTSFSSVRAHHKKAAVDWPLVMSLTPGLCLGVLLGVKTAISLPGHVLQLAIGSFLLLVSVQMGFALLPKGDNALPDRPALFAVGGVVGWVSAIFGIGGGSLTVPFLSWRGVTMQRAVASSAACGLPIALVGMTANVFFPGAVANLPSLATGFVYWPAVLGIVCASYVFAKLGAVLAHRLDPAKLKRLFALFLSFVGFYMIYKGLDGLL